MFEQINYTIRNSEASIVNILSALAPWAAPIAPMYMTYVHMIGQLSFPPEIAWFVAAVVEVLGFSAISTIIGFWMYNRRKVAEYRKAPVWVAVASFAAYLLIIIAINVAIDASNLLDPGLHDWIIVSVRGLLTLLSVPAGVILAVRVQHKEMLDTAERERKEAKAQKVAAVAPAREPQERQYSDATYKRKQFFADTASGKLAEKLNGQEANAENIAAYYGVSPRTVFRWMKTLKKKG